MNEQDADHSDNAKLADALNFLCSQKRTGKLLIREEGREGEIFFAEGGVTHAQFDRYSGLQALLFMLSWQGATYNFTPKQTTDQKTIEIEAARLLPFLAKRVREWHQMKEANPTILNTVLCLLPQAMGTVRLKKEEWDILARIDGRRSLKEISDEMCVAPFDLVKAMQRFRNAGLIGEGTRYPKMASAVFRKDFVLALEKELTQALGPIAPMLLEDALKDLGASTEPLTEEKTKILLERLSSAIPKGESRLRFQQAARILVFEFADAAKLPYQGEEQEREKE